MGKRQDGRIEPGQKLSGAISARAWNRAQDAADIVLGERTGFGAEPGAGFTSSLVAPCKVTTDVEGVSVGHAVVLFGNVVQSLNVTHARQPDLKASPPDKFVPSWFCLEGAIRRAAAPAAGGLSSTSDSIRRNDINAIGVIIGGAVMPKPGIPQIVQVCIAGLCMARVRQRGLSLQDYGFVQPAMLRETQDDADKLAGCLEIVDCGVHRLLKLGTQGRVDQLGQPPNVTYVNWGLVLL
jgi:hypothetical protein